MKKLSQNLQNEETHGMDHKIINIMNVVKTTWDNGPLSVHLWAIFNTFLFLYVLSQARQDLSYKSQVQSGMSILQNATQNPQLLKLFTVFHNKHRKLTLSNRL